MDSGDYDNLKKKYISKLNTDFSMMNKKDYSSISSSEYKKFKQESIKTSFTMYEKLCNFSEKILNIKPNQNDLPTIKKEIELAHISVTPEGAMSFSILIPLIYIAITILSQLLISTILSVPIDFLLTIFFLISGLVFMVVAEKIPHLMANDWRIKVSNQLVIGLFYIVTFMRNVSNLEVALRFAADHLGPPLSVDYQRILWKVETGSMSLDDALEEYLNFWRDTNQGYVEAFHLVIGSLYEEEESRRIELLNKSMEVLLDDTYDSMLHYAQNLKSPISAIYMLGITLPVFSLILLPLLVGMMNIKWYDLVLIYNVTIPLYVAYEARNVLSLRPGGISNINLSFLGGKNLFRKVPLKTPFGSMMVNPKIISIFVFMVLFIIGISPLIYHAYHPNVDFSMFNNPSIKFFDYRNVTYDNGTTILVDGKATTIGPFGLGSLLFSLIATLSIALLFGIYYKLKTKTISSIKDNSRKIEHEFESSIYELGNKLGSGIPLEVAIEKTGKELGNTSSGNFFKLISQNLTNGFGLNDAIFNKKIGAIIFFPSKVIEGVMRLLLESAKKGPAQASKAMMSFSKYLRKIDRVQERLNDLLSEVISSMKSQIRYLTPLISGIVLALASLMSLILGEIKLRLVSLQLQNQTSDVTATGGNINSIATLFGNGIPMVQFQLILGIFLLEIVWIMSGIIALISTDGDEIDKEILIGKNMIMSALLYCFLAAVLSVVFNIVGGSINLG